MLVLPFLLVLSQVLQLEWLYIACAAYVVITFCVTAVVLARFSVIASGNTRLKLLKGRVRSVNLNYLRWVAQLASFLILIWFGKILIGVLALMTLLMSMLARQLIINLEKSLVQGDRNDDY